MTRRRKIVLLVAALLPLILICGTMFYLRFADLSGWRDTVASLASDAIGRELRIGGEFHPEIGLTTRVVASNVTLANPEWSDDPHMVAVDRLDASIDLLSIISGPITLHDVKISGARVRFEVSKDGVFNWDFNPGEPPGPPGPDVELTITDAELRDVALVYSRPGNPTLEAQVAHLGFVDGGTGMLDLELDGTIQEAAFDISGRLGTFIGLINTDAVTHDLEGKLAESRFSLEGGIGDLGSLSMVDSRVKIQGPELGPLLELIGLEPALGGPFVLNTSVAPAPEGSSLEIHGEAGGITASVAGTVDNLTAPGYVDVGIDLSGPDIRAIADLAGIEELPLQEFSVTGRLAWQGFPITFDDLSVRVGPNTLDANGILGRPPLMLGTDFRFEGEGPDASALAAIAGLSIPAEAYSASGRLIRADEGVRVEELEIRLGRSTLSADGIVGDPPGYAGTSLELEASIDRPDRWGRLVGRALPRDAFEIAGRFSEGEQSIKLEGVTARMGSHWLAVDGGLHTDRNMVGTDLEIRASGLDFSKPASFARLENAPSVEYRVQGGLRVVSGGYELRDVKANIGELNVRASGIVQTGNGLQGSVLELSSTGPGFAELEWLTRTEIDLDGDFEVTGSVEVTNRGYELEGATVRVGEITASVDGLVTSEPGLDGTDLRGEISGSELSALEGFLRQKGLPASPFSLTGSTRIHTATYELESLQFEVDGNRFDVSGVVAAEPGLAGTDLEVAVAVPDLELLGGLAKDLVDLPALPAEPLRLTSRLAIDESGYLLEGFEGSLGRAEFSVNGRIGSGPGLVGTDLAIDSDGPDASLFKALTGVSIPVAPFRVQGRLRRTDDGYTFDRFSVQLADYRLRAHGTVGEPPRFEGTDLDLEASGQGTTLIRELVGFDRLPDKPFRISGRFEGTPEIFTAEPISVELGESDLRGSLAVDIQGKPSVAAHLDSRFLDLSPYLPRLVEEDGSPAVDDDTTKPQETGPVFSQEPLNLDVLDRADGEIRIKIDRLRVPAKVFEDVEVHGRLHNGNLEISRLNMTGQREGRGSASLTIGPSHAGYRFSTTIDFDAIRLDLGSRKTFDPTTQPAINIDVQLESEGRSLHEMAINADGFVQIVAGNGVMDNAVLDAVTADILATLLNAFNPFAKEEATTEMQCGIALLSFENGQATLEPMALQSDKMTMLGRGKADLDTEKINFEWITKPRKGIGISASMLTNPYIKVGGTLRKPAVELKGMEAVASTGVAVATMGLSLVAKGMLDRITAEKKVCKKALEEIEARGHATDLAPEKGSEIQEK